MTTRHGTQAAARPARGPGASTGVAAALPHTSLKDLRRNARQTQEDLAAALGVGQDTISRLEHRHDMLLSTLRHYIESVGGRLELVVTLPGQPPVVIDPVGDGKRVGAKRGRRPAHGPGGR